MADPAKIAVLITCFNRRALTLSCLETLENQNLFRRHHLFLVDDGSTDGTGDAVRATAPDAHVIQGTGSLFWNGGMRLAWEHARAAGVNYDFYLWLNDDVKLAAGALDMLVADADATVRRGGAVIVAGATCDPDSGIITYGAHRCPAASRPLRLSLLEPEGKPIPADSFSGNIVLVSAAAAAQIGNLRPDFEHIYGDLDYGFRARAAHVPVMLASKVAGTCSAHSEAGSSLDEGAGKLVRLKRRLVEDRKVHARDWRRFVRLHGGGRLVALGHRLAPYVRILLSIPNRHASNILNREPSR